MKGKIFNFKIVLTMMLIIVSGFCFVVSTQKQTNKITNKTVALEKQTIAGEDFSAVTDGIILSVEKVMVSSSETEYTDKSGNKFGYPNKIATGAKTFMGGHDELLESAYKTVEPSNDAPVDLSNKDHRVYTFKDLANGNSSKTIVEDGSVVRMDNVLSSEKIIMKDNESYQEAIMISFGAYVKIGESVNIAQNDNPSTTPENETVHAGITQLTVTMYHNGDEVENLPEIRNIGNATNGLYFDFVHLITQEEDNSNEGYYQLSFEYMVNGASGSASFSFFILNNSTYTQEINPENKDYGYNAKPTLGWTQSGESDFIRSETDGYVRYYIGENGIFASETAYPTLTYDYTKYKVTYEHTANQKKTSYDLSVDYKASGEAELIMTATSSSGTTKTPYELKDYQETELNNLVSIMFTKPGTYTFNYEFLYRGYDAGITPDLSDFKTETLKLSIHGMSTQYSKTNYEGANLQYFELADSESQIDLIVPDGYELNSEISNKANQKLGFVYKVVENGARVGNVISENSLDSLANGALKSKNTLNQTDSNDYKFLTTIPTGKTEMTVKDVEGASNNKSALTSVLANITYIPTNQGSLWIEGNDKYNDGFYFHSASKIAFNDLFEEETYTDDKGTPNTDDDTEETREISSAETFTNVTTFNKKGYYLVFVKVEPSGVTDESLYYWQIFAFQYTSSSVNIDVQAVDGNSRTAVAGGKYTNKSVEILWKNPGIFDREIKGYYYSAKNENKTKEQLLSTVATPLSTYLKTIEGVKYCVAELGDKIQVPDESFVKFLIRLESEGESATHKIFTIDRKSISGVQPYLIQEMYAGNSIYYAYATDGEDNIIPIDNSITDSYATFNWDEKGSGASIKATYSYTPFSLVTKTVDNVKKVAGNNGKTWILTNYELGETIVGSELVKPTSTSLVSGESILFYQGIYIINLKDEAGNECSYAFVIDKTNNYFYVNPQDTENSTEDAQLLSNTSIVSGTDVDYSIGDYKAFKLSTTDATLSKLIEAAATNNFSGLSNYYSNSTTTNKSALTKLFQKFDGEYYFTVENKDVEIYDGKVVDDDLAGIVSTSGTLEYNVDDGASYYQRTLYAKAVNNEYTRRNVNKTAYVTVTINKDNARGSVYYASSKISTVPSENENDLKNVYKLKTGSDGVATNGDTTYGIHKAGATSAKHVAFTWKTGSGNFEVSKVTYQIYSLNQNYWDEDLTDGKQYFYYSNANDVVIAYAGKKTNEETTIKDGFGLITFNIDNDSKAGLYVITRYYESNENLGEDVQVKNYYFIVDRNGIIQGDVGGSIKIELLEGESELTKNDFSTQNADDGTLNDPANDISNEKYYIYLSTTKLPVTLNIPLGKYLSEDNNSSNVYEAGQLNVSVYFINSEDQIDNDKYQKDSQICIYNSNYKKREDLVTNTNDGTFEINIRDYLATTDYAYLISRLTESTSATNTDRGEWLFLPGTYVIRISDNVYDTQGKTHTKLIGFKINSPDDGGPSVDSFTGAQKTDDNMVKINSLTDEVNATVSQEFLKVVLPAYDATDETKAQVDPNYIYIKQYFGDDKEGKEYLNHKYKAYSGIDLTTETENLVTINNNEISVWLDTKLRVDPTDSTSEINYANLNTPLYYTITVRYKLNKIEDINDPKLKQEDFEKYINCYKYYVTNATKEMQFYEKTYTITIDREAPSENIGIFNGEGYDSLLEAYKTAHEVDEMMEADVHETGTNLYFTKQYTKYYQSNRENKGYIYPYQVTEGTDFKTTDVSRVLINPINDLKTYDLTLPVIDESKYEYSFDSFTNIEKFGQFQVFEDGEFYEIVELDEAGNATQYVIHYEPATPSIQIPLTFTLTSGKSSDGVVKIEYNEANQKWSGLIDLAGEKIQQINAYAISANGETIVENDYFFKIDVVRGSDEELMSVVTDATTDFTILAEQIAKTISDKKFGKFTITISTRTSSSSVVINLYDQADVIPLDIEKLVEVDENDKYKINLHGANIPDEEKGIWYFATKIIVTKGTEVRTFYGYNETNGIVYYEGQNIVSEIVCGANETYYIEMTDVLTKTTTYRFNTSGMDFIIIEFEDVDNDEAPDYYKGIVGTDFVYYGFTSATFRYDNTVYSSEIYQKVGEGFEPSSIRAEQSNSIYDEIFIKKLEKGLKEIKIVLYYGEIPEVTYFITIDTRISDVALRDYNSGEKRDIIKEFSNINFDHVSVRPDSIGTGFMNLAWNPVEENDYFDYSYTLHELLKNETYRTIDLTGVSNYVIATDETSNGIYKFEIRVYGKDGTYLGNKVYAFEVKEISTQIYYVRDENGVAIQPNSNFMVDNITDLKSTITSTFNGIKTTLELDLFITNQNLDVVVAASDVDLDYETFKTTPYEFTIYRISKENAYEIYFGVLRIDETSNIVQNLKIVGVENYEVKTSTNFTISANTPSSEISLTREFIESSDYLLQKNLVYINAYYNDQLIASEPFNGKYQILGNGQFSFTFTDLAGNVHEFEEDDDGKNVETIDKVKVYVLREVVVLINDEAPVENAFYNGEVMLSIYASNKYVTGSISITAEKNGKSYSPTGFNPYIFTEYGNYWVKVTAKYNNGTKEILLEKIVTFTIINVNEARKSIDLTSLNGCKITTVLNSLGQDVTTAFCNMMQQSAASGGLNISYEDIVAYETNPNNVDKLNVVSGKMTFSITYLYEDGTYPARTVNLSFTLNNEDASIPCTLEKGGTTKKDFTIYFNPAILYEQVGEAYVYINDKMVAHINETSANTEVRIKTSFDKDGDGDYYIKLVSSSGVILDSYKVTIKEPLNVWAIIIIVVVVAVVATVVTTIILLRRKMRIR